MEGRCGRIRVDYERVVIFYNALWTFTMRCSLRNTSTTAFHTHTRTRDVGADNNTISFLIVLKDMQQGRSTVKVAAAATFCVCMKFHSGKLISMEISV